MRARAAIAVVSGLIGWAGIAGSAGAAPARCPSDRVAPPPAAPASDAQVSRYLRVVAGSSARVRVGVLGHSVLGRELPYAIVSSPGHLAHLASIGARLRALRDGASGAAGRVTARQPAIVWLAGTVHGNEPSGTDADLRVLRTLATGSSAFACSVLERLVVVIVPVQNPDGRAAFTRVNANGFDLNRDWFAATQPETTGRVALLRRYPPIALDDQHEQDGTAVATPPNARPVLPVMPAVALRALRERFAPALRRALHPTGRAFDLLYPGYADSASTTLDGAAGMTIEVGSASPYATRVAQHVVAARTVLAVASRSRGPLLRAWAASRRAAAAVPGRTFLLRADLHGADAATLVGRLEADGVRVGRLAADTEVEGFHAFGTPPGAGGPAVLPAGTWTITTAQPARAWVQALLEENAGRGLLSAYDDTSWSNSLLMGTAGGWTDGPLAPAATTSATVPPVPAAPAYAFAGDSLGGLSLATRLLIGGAAVARVPVTGELTASGVDPATIARLAAPLHVALAGVDAPPAAAVPLRAPHVALLDDLVRSVTGPPGQEDSGRHESRAWMAFLLRDRLGLTVDDLSPAQLAAGDLTTSSASALVIADGEGTLSPAALAAVHAFAQAGGTVVAVGALGLSVAQAAGLTTAVEQPPAGFVSAGATFAVQLDGSAPLAWGAGGSLFVLDADDPVLAPASGAVAHHPATPQLLGGYARDTAVLAASPVVLDQPAGAGRLALFAFDPAYRGYVDGASRLLVNALLAPATPTPTPTAAAAAAQTARTTPASAGARRSAASRRSARRR
jgi:hypothetical protein